jgi:hypothetical protein
MSHDFKAGDKVVTASGFTSGEVLEAGDDYIDVRSTSGYRYRNCKPSMWRHENDPTVKIKVQAKPLERGERCYMMADGMPFNGTVVTGNADECFVTFDETAKTIWVKRKALIRGEAPE